MKTCNKCNFNKETTYFNRKKSNKDGLNTICRQCQKLENDFNRIRLKETEYYTNYRKENINVLLKYVENNRVKINRNKTKYRLANPIKVKTATRNWLLANPYNTAIRNLLKNTLKRLGKPKEGKTIDLLGYSVIDLKQHLESLFTEGMSWDNYGQWHIDHIKPVSKFDPDTPMNVVNALSNLRPLWATTREINGVIYEGNLNKNKY